MIEIGDTAILRSTGRAASQSQTSSQEAKDFKVVIGLDIPQTQARPVLHRKNHHRHRKNVLADPDSGFDDSPEGRICSRQSRVNRSR